MDLYARLVESQSLQRFVGSSKESLVLIRQLGESEKMYLYPIWRNGVDMNGGQLGQKRREGIGFDDGLDTHLGWPSGGQIRRRKTAVFPIQLLAVSAEQTQSASENRTKRGTPPNANRSVVEFGLCERNLSLQGKLL